MVTEHWDVAILGSGFAGSLTALLLKRLGLRVGLIDRARHPRFAIGESSTPVANMVLRDLAVRYDLPRLLPLAKWGTWRRNYPELGCGLKRGFSYFRHEPGEPFRPTPDHRAELLVAASSDDEHSDTQWLRADVDHFLVGEARDAGIPVWEATTVQSITPQAPSGEWTLEVSRPCSHPDGHPDGHPDNHTTLRSRFLIDGTGEAGLLPRALDLEDRIAELHTHSRALFSHFLGVRDWGEMLVESGGSTADHPFACDDAAQHHLFDGAWAWVLRFANGLTSVGLVIDPRRHPPSDLTPQGEWDSWLARYPSWKGLLAKAQLATTPGTLVRTARLQRCWEQAASASWALLPHTAGFIDPLHSTGIAHSLCGVERLVASFEQHWGRESWEAAMREYDRIWRLELRQMDQLVDGCFRSFDHFPLLVAYSLLYFAAATTYERRRVESPDHRGAFLLADDPDFSTFVTRCHRELRGLTASPSTDRDRDAYIGRLRAGLAPFDHVGLRSPTIPNMFAHTAAPP